MWTGNRGGTLLPRVLSVPLAASIPLLGTGGHLMGMAQESQPTVNRRSTHRLTMRVASKK